MLSTFLNWTSSTFLNWTYYNKEYLTQLIYFTIIIIFSIVSITIFFGYDKNNKYIVTDSEIVPISDEEEGNNFYDDLYDMTPLHCSPILFSKGTEKNHDNLKRYYSDSKKKNNKIKND